MAAKKAAASTKKPAAKKKRPHGWGGPARGKGSGKPRYSFGAPGPGRGHFSLAGERRLEREARIGQEMRQLLYGFATDDGRDDTVRLQAASKLMDRIEGMPVQRVLQPETDAFSRMTDEELEQHRTEQAKRVATFDTLKLPAGGDVDPVD